MNIKKTLAQWFRCGLTLISPRLNTEVIYRIKFNKKLDLKHPVTLNEKILWLKFNTYWENSLIKQCADKLRVREYIIKKGFSDLLVRMIGAYDNVNYIDWDSLPSSFALKLNVGCGSNIIVNDKSKLDIEATKNTLEKWLKPNLWYLGYSEMQYKGVKPYIIIEEYLGAEDGELPEDYKFYCMNGICRTIMVCKDRVIGKKARYFFMSRDWELYPYTIEAIESPNESIPKPRCLEKAIEYAERLSKGFPFVRVDLYIIGDKIYFGELTFTPAAGMDTDLKVIPPNSDKNVDAIFGEWLNV